jgi:hypothetical protein
MEIGTAPSLRGVSSPFKIAKEDDLFARLFYPGLMSDWTERIASPKT